MDVGSNCLMRAFLSHVPNNHLDACLDTCSCASGHVAGHADEQTRRQATAPRCLCIWRDPCARFGSATEQRRWHPRDAFNSSCSRPNYVRASAQQAAGTNAGLGDGVRTRFAGALRNAKNQGTVGCFRSRCWQFVADGATHRRRSSVSIMELSITKEVIYVRPTIYCCRAGADFLHSFLEGRRTASLVEHAASYNGSSSVLVLASHTILDLAHLETREGNQLPADLVDSWGALCNGLDFSELDWRFLFERVQVAAAV